MSKKHSMLSMRVQMTILLAGILSGTLLSCILINSLFLSKYYYTEKVAALDSMLEYISDIDDVDEYFNDSENCNTVKNKCETAGIALTIFGSDSDSIFNSGDDLKDFTRGQMFRGELTLSDDNDVTDTFYDRHTQIEYLQKFGSLDSDTYYLMRVPITAMRDSVAISNRFFAYIGVIAIIVSTFLMTILSYYFTKPIKRLVKISEQMSSLNFNVKYKDHGTTELDALGNSMNKLSTKLEATITDLKNANSKLEQDIEKKEKIDKMRTDFISNASHELKTPIALIQGYAEGLKEGINDDDPESRNFYCDVIIDEANKMNHLVRNLLSLNQMESGGIPLDMSRFDIISVINGVLERSKILIEQKELDVYFDNSKECYVWGDEFWIEQVLTNYVTNALNHVIVKGTIKISLESFDDNLRVTVYNDGKPIPEEDLDKLWIKFYKVDKARTREYGGNGIGLSLVKAIMDQHKQNYGVYNLENGVAFYFEVEKEKIEHDSNH